MQYCQEERQGSKCNFFLVKAPFVVGTNTKNQQTKELVGICHIIGVSCPIETPGMEVSTLQKANSFALHNKATTHFLPWPNLKTLNKAATTDDLMGRKGDIIGIYIKIVFLMGVDFRVSEISSMMCNMGLVLRYNSQVYCMERSIIKFSIVGFAIIIGGVSLTIRDKRQIDILNKRPNLNRDRDNLTQVQTFMP